MSLQEFFANVSYEDIIQYAVYLLSFIFCTVTFFRTGKINKKLYGGISMKDDVKKDAKKEKFVQTFDVYVTQYRLNKSSGELVELPDKLNLQEFINSSASTCLQAQLEKLDLTSVTDADKIVELQNDLSDKLDYLAEAQDYFDDLKDKYQLPADSSWNDVLVHLQTLKNNADAELQALQNKSKGDSKDEKKKVE